MYNFCICLELLKIDFAIALKNHASLATAFIKIKPKFGFFIWFPAKNTTRLVEIQKVPKKIAPKIWVYQIIHHAYFFLGYKNIIF